MLLKFINSTNMSIVNNDNEITKNMCIVNNDNKIAKNIS